MASSGASSSFDSDAASVSSTGAGAAAAAACSAASRAASLRAASSRAAASRSACSRRRASAFFFLAALSFAFSRSRAFRSLAASSFFEGSVRAAGYEDLRAHVLALALLLTEMPQERGAQGHQRFAQLPLVHGHDQCSERRYLQR